MYFLKKNKSKISIIGSLIIIVLSITISIMLFASKESTLFQYVKSNGPASASDELIREGVKNLKETVKYWGGSINLGAGCIVPAIMMLLGAGSLGGVICLSAKE